GLHLMFEDAEAAQHGQAGVLERRELARERAQRLARDAADGEFAALLAFGDLLLAALFGRAGHFGDLGHEVAHLPDLLLGLFLAQGVDGVFDLSAAGVHRLVLVGRHGITPEHLASGVALAPRETYSGR